MTDRPRYRFQVWPAGKTFLRVELEERWFGPFYKSRRHDLVNASPGKLIDVAAAVEAMKQRLMEEELIERANMQQARKLLKKL